MPDTYDYQPLSQASISFLSLGYRGKCSDYWLTFQPIADHHHRDPSFTFLDEAEAD